jgi:hypothetical protein
MSEIVWILPAGLALLALIGLLCVEIFRLDRRIDQIEKRNKEEYVKNNLQVSKTPE